MKVAFADITPAPDMSALPVRVDRRAAAALISRFFFPVSHRTLEMWPLCLRHVNGRALIETAELFALAEKKLNAAPVLMGGKAA